MPNVSELMGLCVATFLAFVGVAFLFTPAIRMVGYESFFWLNVVFDAPIFWLFIGRHIWRAM